MILELVCCLDCLRWLVLLLVCAYTTVTGMAVAATVKLTQASMSRLGEVSRGSPRPSRANGRLGDLLNFEQASVSPRRGESRLSENVRRLLFQIRELSPRRRELAWARDSRLGEAPQPERRIERECVQFGVFLSFGGWAVFYYTIMWWYGGNWVCILGGYYMWGDYELGMISTWIVYDKLDTYVCTCGHKLGMSNNESWWLVNLWYGWYEEKHFTHDWE